MLRSFADTVGTHFIESAIIVSTGDPMRTMKFDMRKAVEALPALKHVRELMFACRCMMHTTYDVDMGTLEDIILSPLGNLQRLELDDMNNLTDWTFLRKDWALRLRSLAVKAFDLFHESGEYGQPEIDVSGQAEILEYCTDFAHLDQGKSKKLKIPGWRISSEFLRRIVTAVSQCKDRLTVVVDGVPGFIGNDAGYTRFEVPPENPESSRASGSVLFSSLDGSHRVVQTYHGKPMVAVTNNPFVTTWNDACRLGVEGF
ncbi:hypothetical protein AAVH_24149 [Aphelenchoides avenae]|nr:hypothetical protein AAVH_24149 [Aphelenchus avenae]